MYVDELDLEQLLADPLIRLVMKSDAVDESEIRRLAESAGVRRRAVEQRWLPALAARPGPCFHPVCGYA